jgi:hypothetical protein
MKVDPLWSMLKRIPFHPFLYAIYPVLALLGHNITEVSPDVIVRPLLVILVGTLLLFVALRLALHDTLKTGLLVTLALVLFFTYGQIYNWLKEDPLGLALLARHRYLLIAYTTLFILGAIAVLKGRLDYQNSNLALNLVSIFLIVYPAYQVVRYSIEEPAGLAFAAKWTPQMKLAFGSSQGDKPDVYYIILDGYSRADAIQKYLGYDNTPFLDQLRALGFVIGECSRSNYGGTRTSLTSSLNMEQLPTIFGWAAQQGLSTEQAYGFLIHSQVRKQFESLGYKTVAFNTGFRWTRMDDADLYITREKNPLGLQWLTPFEKMLADTTLASIYTDWQTQNYQNKFIVPDHPKSYFIELEKFNFTELPKIARLDDPTFTFVHILIPHYPFVFSPDGILTDPGYFSSYGESPINPQYFKDGYVKEIRYDNQQLIPILSEILTDSPTPPIIIIQGDHGLLGNRFPILNAYYLPGQGSKKVYPTITPVNTFRLIFDTYFGGSYSLLPDESFKGTGSGKPIPEAEPDCQ